MKNGICINAQVLKNELRDRIAAGNGKNAQILLDKIDVIPDDEINSLLSINDDDDFWDQYEGLIENSLSFFERVIKNKIVEL